MVNNIIDPRFLRKGNNSCDSHPLVDTKLSVLINLWSTVVKIGRIEDIKHKSRVRKKFLRTLKHISFIKQISE